MSGLVRKNGLFSEAFISPPCLSESKQTNDKHHCKRGEEIKRNTLRENKTQRPYLSESKQTNDYERATK